MIDLFRSAQTWALAPGHLRGLAALADGAARGARVSRSELVALLGFPEVDRPPVERRGRAVAIVPLRGLLVPSIDFFGARIPGGTAVFRDSLREALRHPDVESILLDVDSAGGSTDGIEEAASELFEARKTKRIVASINALGASAAFWIASQAHELTMTPSGHAGSIGVMAVHLDVSERAKREGLAISIISAGRFKHEASEWAPLTPGARDHLQGLVDDRYQAFVRDVARGRKVSAATVERDFGQGRVHHARQALAARMVDRIESFDVTLARLTGQKPKPVKLTAAARAFVARVELDFLEAKGRREEERMREFDPAHVLAELEALEREW